MSGKKIGHFNIGVFDSKGISLSYIVILITMLGKTIPQLSESQRNPPMRTKRNAYLSSFKNTETINVDHELWIN